MGAGTASDGWAGWLMTKRPKTMAVTAKTTQSSETEFGAIIALSIFVLSWCYGD
jgi:hypothetical protein